MLMIKLAQVFGHKCVNPPLYSNVVHRYLSTSALKSNTPAINLDANLDKKQFRHTLIKHADLILSLHLCI